jgi:homoserine dehydrogenase
LFVKIALLGYGNVGKAFARLLESKRGSYPFAIVGIHTARHGSAFNPKGLGVTPGFGEAAATVEEFLDRAQPTVAIEITTLNARAANRRFRIFGRRLRGRRM